MKILVTSIVDLKKFQHCRLHQFVRHLSEKHDVTVVSINDRWKGRQNDLDANSNEFNDILERINYVYLTEKEVTPILQELFFRKKLRGVLEEDEFDVHLNYNTLTSGYTAAKRIRTIYDIADDLVAMIKDSPQIPSILRPLGGALAGLIVKKSIERAEKVIVTTEVLKETYDIPDEKCEVIPNGVDANLFRDYGDAKEELGLDGFVIGYVGALREWVDLKPVFQALKDLDEEIKMVIVGGEVRFKENVALARRYGVSDRVIFTGMVPHPQVPKYISAMDVCLIPFDANAISRSALPLKLFEYMACKKPVISSDIPAVERIANGKVLYASAKCEYKDKILKMYRDEDLRLRMGEEGRRFVEENCDWRVIVERMERVLVEVGMVA